MGVPNFISEDQIEKAAIKVFTQPGINYRHIDCFYSDTTGRESEKEVVIKPLLWQKLEELNPELPTDALKNAFYRLTSTNRLSTLFNTNREVMKELNIGIEVNVTSPDGRTEPRLVKVIDWDNSTANDFLIVSQLWIQGPVYRLRPDLIIYINGLPLVVIELKNSDVEVEMGYKDNLTRYKEAIPDLFVYNAFLMVSNGSKTRIGSTFTSWEFFFPWLRVSDEKQPVNKEEIENEGISLEYAIKGLLTPKKLIDYIDNFIFFYHDSVKICAKNHQFLGVNNAIARFSYLQQEAKKGVLNNEHNKLGVFWHTQGSGKSFSMVMLAQKIMRKFQGNYTFLIVTDREDLDGQIYKNFLHSKVVNAKEKCRPHNSQALREILATNTKCIFTLIQKFRYTKGMDYPLLSERSDIIVFVDEAHRTQYKELADNMRMGLPNAQFMAFTGTPLFGSKKLTNEWFGENVSEYNFSQAVEDEATVPLFYRKRLPQMNQANTTLNEDFLEIIEDENLSDENRLRIEKEFANELSVLRATDRLKDIARDIARHFPYRGYLGKGIVVAIDKFTTVRLYNYVKYYWAEELKRINKQLARATGSRQKELLELRQWMRDTEMAVIVSEEAGEEEKFQKEGLDIKIHRNKMNTVNDEGQDLEDLFKDPNSKFRLVFVCSMWLTGFDVPTASTLYLDKPMKDHTLMQAIARVNRITDVEINGKKKINGLVIDYCNVFGRLKKAMSTYAGNIIATNERLVNDESVKKANVLFDTLHKSITECCTWCKNHQIDLTTILASEEVFSQAKEFYKFADIILGIKYGREQFRIYDNIITSFYDASRPEILKFKKEFKLVQVIHYLRKIVDNNINDDNIDTAKQRVKTLLDESLLVENELLQNTRVSEPIIGYGIKAYREIDLSKLDIDKLKKEFKETEYKNIKIDNIRNFVQRKLNNMLTQNTTRTSFAVRLQNIIDRYNAGSIENEEYFEELIKYNNALSNEEQRATRENLAEDELEIFDLLKKDNLTKDETLKVKLAARELLNKLKRSGRIIFIREWYKDTAQSEKVRNLIGDTLDKFLPDSYDRDIFAIKKINIYNCILSKAIQGDIMLGA